LHSPFGGVLGTGRDVVHFPGPCLAGVPPGIRTSPVVLFAKTASSRSRPGDIRSQLDELSQLPAALAQARKLTDLGGKALAVVTASEGQQAGWSAAQDHMVALSTNSVHRLVPGDPRASLLVDEGDSAYSVRAIADVVRSVRTRSPLPKS
jgi:hypothetical protein